MCYHPLQNFVSYHSLSPIFCVFVSNLATECIPNHVCIPNHLSHPKWKEAMIEELNALEKNYTWELTTFPEGKRTIGCKCVYTLKFQMEQLIGIRQDL